MCVYILLVMAHEITSTNSRIRVLLAKNTNLRRTRDLLLPKLISGAQDVSKLDIDTGGS